MNGKLAVEVIAEALAKHQLSEARLWDPFRGKYRKRCECGAAVDHGISAHQASVIAALPDIATMPRAATEVAIAHPGVCDDGSIHYTPIGSPFAHEEAARASLPFVHKNGWSKAVVVTRNVTAWAAAAAAEEDKS